MNYSVCGINEQGEPSTNKADVIFSTFVNFECFYLKMVELCPASIQKYFSEYGLLVDEADSILIDEIANGTIISRSMNSNAIEILKFVYEQYHNNKTFEETYKLIMQNKEWEKCKELIKPHHISQMYEEIKLVHTPEYTDGKRYSIETIEVKKKKKKKMNRILKKVILFSKDVLTDAVKEFIKGPDAEDDDDDDDEEDDEEDDDEEESDDEDDGKPTVIFKHIVPFGYDKNGILEPNKEFSGFVQQFIAIKESIDNHVENMIINDISMSYLYISHPIFVKLYGTVCGFTGTIGKKEDKNIFRNEYSLITMKVPRHSPNLSVEFPMILCENFDERNQKIITEIIEFHKKGNPVLAIFQDLKEIDEIEYLLTLQGIKYINIFNGKDEIIKPDEIAGINGSVSLGTNFCGRGTNIKSKGLPLHVIVSYYSSNSRVMSQAFGRTARQGSKGTYHVICLKSQFYNPVDILKNTNSLLDEFSIKSKRQGEFVDHFEAYRSWIFSGFPEHQNIDRENLKNLRKIKINVNRIIASEYIFPICMDLKTFLTIQEQKIFSLYNCPNSKFTWRLFQRYLRELILESWSLLINEIDQEFKNKNKGNEHDNEIDQEYKYKGSEYGNEIGQEYKNKGSEYDNEIGKKMNNLFKILEENYLPKRKDNIFETFMFIFNKIRDKYENDILNDFTEMACPLIEFDPSSFFSCRAGFKPYALLSDSGARICSKNFKKTNFIKDPELKFEQRTVKKKVSLISITQKIDDIFNDIFMKVNEILGSKTFLKLFLRRTLAGCEFGFCLILDIENNNKEFSKKHPFCIIDRDPLLVFTIFVRSLAPVLAIILISVLIYLTSIASKIAKWFTFPANAKEIAKKTATIVFNAFSSNIANKIYEKILIFLETNLNTNIDHLAKYDKENAAIIRKLKELFDSSKASDVTNKISGYLGDVFNIKSKFGDIGDSLLNPVQLMKISAYLILLLASFIMNYRNNKNKIQDYTTESKEYDDNPNQEKINELCERHIKEVDDEISNFKEISNDELNEFENSYQQKSKTYLYKMSCCNIIDKLIKSPSFKIDQKALIEKGAKSLAQGLFLNNHQKCTRMTYSGNKRIFQQQVRFYLTNIHPSIIPFIGYSIDKNNRCIYLDSKEKGSLKSFINSGGKIDLTHKLIIAFGIACAMNHLHNNKIVHRYLKPSNILLDSNLYPYLSNFHRAKQTQIQFPYYLTNMSLKYEPPEFASNFKDNQNSFYLDVYSFAMILYILITEKSPFHSYSKSRQELKEDIKNGLRPEFPDSFPNELKQWKELIIKCWDQNPLKRPLFNEIILTLEKDFIKNNDIDRVLFKNYKENVLKITEFC